MPTPGDAQITNIPEHGEVRANSSLTRWGLFFTAAYLVLLIGLVVFASNVGWINWQPLSINELGDFLAGVLGPLSIFWLILGFLQQGRELRLQVSELSRSVEQQKELVSVSRDTLDHERSLNAVRERSRRIEVQPRLVFAAKEHGIGLRSMGYAHYKVDITNSGGPAFDVSILISPAPKHFDLPTDFFGRGYLVTADLQLDGRESQYLLTFNYKDEEDQRHRVDYAINSTMFGLKIVEVGRAEGSSVA